MGQGAFTTRDFAPEMTGEIRAQPGPEDFLARLQQLAPVVKPPVPPAPVSHETRPPSGGLSALAKMVRKPAQEPRNAPRNDVPIVPAPSFVPGKPGAPKSGMTIHQIMKDPDVLTTVQSVVQEFEQANPGRMLKGPHIRMGLDAKGLEVSQAQAAKIAKRIKDEHDKLVRQQVVSYTGKAAKKVMG